MPRVAVLQKGEGFLIAGLGQEVLQPCGQVRAHALMLGGEGFGDLLQPVQMRGGIGSAQRVIRDHGETLAQQRGEGGKTIIHGQPLNS